MTRIPDSTDPQPGDEFTCTSERRTILARHGDWCWVDFDNGGEPLSQSVGFIAKYYKPVVTWPDLPTDHYAVQYPDGGVIAFNDKAGADAWAARDGGGRVVRVRYEPLDGDQ